jgi:hypothetical protein
MMHPSSRLRSRASEPQGQLPQPKDEATHRIHSLFRLRKLVVHRAEYLTAAVILSGGVGVFSRYQTPAYRLPVLLAWGGPTDQYGGVINFQETTYAFRDALRADEHTVVMCGHDGGHVPPPAVAGWGYDFLDAHTVRNGESPVNPETWTLPAICSLAE